MKWKLDLQVRYSLKKSDSARLRRPPVRLFNRSTYSKDVFPVNRTPIYSFLLHTRCELSSCLYLYGFLKIYIRF